MAMEWCCAKCGLSATADDWTLLVAMGWRTTPDNEFRCAICARQEALRFASDVMPASARARRVPRRSRTAP